MIAAVPLSPRMKLKSSNEIKEEILKKFFTKRYQLPQNNHTKSTSSLDFTALEPAVSYGHPKSTVSSSHYDVRSLSKGRVYGTVNSISVSVDC